jgi:hypothetical protein
MDIATNTISGNEGRITSITHETINEDEEKMTCKGAEKKTIKS